MKAGRRDLRFLYDRLTRQYGDLQWWPADGAFEVMVGAVLTQNTAWVNVERAMENLKCAHMLDPERLARARPDRLAELLRPAGYYNVKTRRLQNFCRWYVGEGGMTRLQKRPTDQLRRQLLAIHGVGPETADDMLLYAFGRALFVVDAYTRRIFARLGWIAGDEAYDELRGAVEHRLKGDAALYNQFHALLVMHGKDVCKSRPRCEQCSLSARCAFADGGV